jgi:hypothetical protein
MTKTNLLARIEEWCAAGAVLMLVRIPRGRVDDAVRAFSRHGCPSYAGPAAGPSAAAPHPAATLALVGARPLSRRFGGATPRNRPARRPRATGQMPAGAQSTLFTQEVVATPEIRAMANGSVLPRNYNGRRRPAWERTMSSLQHRMSRLPSLAGDSALTALAAVFAVVTFLARNHGPRPVSHWALPLALLCALSLLLRGRWPVGALLAVGVLGALYLVVTDNQTFAILPTVFIALYSAVAYSGAARPRVWTIALGVCVVLNILNLLTAHAGHPEPPGGRFLPAPPPVREAASPGCAGSWPNRCRRPTTPRTRSAAPTA